MTKTIPTGAKPRYPRKIQEIVERVDPNIFNIEEKRLETAALKRELDEIGERIDGNLSWLGELEERIVELEKKG